MQVVGTLCPTGDCLFGSLIDFVKTANLPPGPALLMSIDKLSRLGRSQLKDNAAKDGLEPTYPRTPRIWQLASFLPWFLLATFLALVAFLFGERLLPATPVEVASVVSLPGLADELTAQPEPDIADSQNFAGPALFQASGWIEADPFPMRVTALYAGVVDKVHVLEGQQVEKGQLLAEMIIDDASLALTQAEAHLESAQARVSMAEAEVELAQARLKSLESETVAARARSSEAADFAERLNASGEGAFSKQERLSATLQAERASAEATSVTLRLREQKAAIRRAESALKAASSDLSQAIVHKQIAQLALDRTKIYAPHTGIVQRLYAAPGMKRMLPMDDLDSATICILFQPEKLQARIDVPLEEAARLFVGQMVRLRSAFLPDSTFHGQVSRIVGEADLQRNTLQVKVRLFKPDPRLRPDFLCRAEFLDSSPNTGAQMVQHSSQPSLLRLFVPVKALLNRDTPSPTAFVIDREGDTIEKRTLTLPPVSTERDGHIEVLAGLRPGELVVLAPSPSMSTGQRIRIIQSQ